jgi:hypothetical protein
MLHIFSIKAAFSEYTSFLGTLGASSTSTAPPAIKPGASVVLG